MGVRTERCRQARPDLRHFEGMRQACAVIVALVVDEDLRLVFEPPEGRRVQDAIPVLLKRGAVSVFLFRVTAAPRFPTLYGVGREGRSFGGLALLSLSAHTPSYSLSHH